MTKKLTKKQQAIEESLIPDLDVVEVETKPSGVPHFIRAIMLDNKVSRTFANLISKNKCRNAEEYRKLRRLKMFKVRGGTWKPEYKNNSVV